MSKKISNPPPPGSKKPPPPPDPPQPGNIVEIPAPNPVLEELRAIRELLTLIAAATVRTALAGDLGAPDNYGLIDKLRAGAPWLSAELRSLDVEAAEGRDDDRG